MTLQEHCLRCTAFMASALARTPTWCTGLKVGSDG